MHQPHRLTNIDRAFADHAIAARRLGAIEPPVGDLEQAVVIGRVRRAGRHTDGHRHARRPGPARGDARAQPFAERHRLLGIEPFRQHHELLTTETEREVGSAHRAHDLGRDLAQHGVAARMAEPVVEGLEVVDVDQQQAHRRAGGRRTGDDVAALRLQPAAVERAGQRIAAAARQQVLVALAIGEQIEHVGDARCTGLERGFFEHGEIDRHQAAIERDGPHLGRPPAEQHGEIGAGEKPQAGVEHELVEGHHRRGGQRDARQQGMTNHAAQPLVEQDNEDAVREQDQRPPDHQRAHLVEEAEIGEAVRGQRRRQMLAHHEGERKQQQVADQQAVDRLAHHPRILADIDQQQQHQLAGEQDGRAGRRDDAGGQGDVEGRGEIGLEEVHHPERAEERADPQPCTRAKEHRENGEVDQGVAGQQRDIRPFRQRHVLAANVCGGRPARLTLGGSIKSLNKERS